VKASIKDIARVAGVSHSTVSRALSDSPVVNPETRARIKRLAREMGYSPDAGARGLVMGRTLTIGVVVTTISDPFIAEVVQGVESTAFKNGYTVILASSGAEPEREVAAVEMLRSKRVDGVIVTASRVGALYKEHLTRIEVPVVLLNNHGESGGPYTFSVRVDDRHGGYLATRHLVERGHRRIAYVSVGEAGHSSDRERQAGYCQALTEAGLPCDPALVFAGNGRWDGGERVLPLLCAPPEPPTAVFCFNDMTAVGLLRSARAAGLSVPEDLAVVGFDDIPIASYVVPSLTTIAQPKFELGEKAMQMVWILIEAQRETATPQVHDTILQGRLVVRESSVGRSE